MAFIDQLKEALKKINDDLDPFKREILDLEDQIECLECEIEKINIFKRPLENERKELLKHIEEFSKKG